MQKLADCIDRGVQEVTPAQEQVRGHVREVQRIAATLDPGRGSSRVRRRRFGRLRRRLARSGDPARVQMAVVMAAFVAGLFAGGDLKGLPEDNLDLERWFRLPKGHERRIHGHRQEYGSSRKGRRWCMPWTPTTPTPNRSASTTCCRTARPARPRASARRSTVAR